jgi:hypothetical protein
VRFIWVTRGKEWGFQFLENAGIADPLSAYESAFAGIENSPEVCRRTDDKVALRFPDPLARKDSAGRVIPHEFVLFDAATPEIQSVEDGLSLIWPLVAHRFSAIWDAPNPL